MVVLAFAALLMQEPAAPRPLPKHVRLLQLEERAKNFLAQKLLKDQPPKACATMIVIPTDPAVDPKFSITPENVPSMPAYAGVEPCFNKLAP